MIPAGWELLPEELLVTIFGYLQVFDLVKASSVCRQWCRVFHEPLLWREIIIRVSNNQDELTEHLEALNKMTNVLSVHVRHIEVIGKQMTRRVRESEPLRCLFLVKLLDALSLNRSLESIFVYQLFGDSYEMLPLDNSQRSRVVERLSAFLESQTSLNYVDFSRIFLSRTYSAMVMQSLARSKSLECLTQLVIGSVFSSLHSRAEIRNQLMEVFASCKQLNYIHLNYFYLQAAGVETVCETLKESLQWLIVETHDTIDDVVPLFNAIISTQEWERACRHVPNLKVAFELPKWRTDFRLYLVKGMPLWAVKSRLNYTPRYTDDVGDTVTMLLYHVSQYFSETIQWLIVSTPTNNSVCSPSKESLIHFICKCKKIKKLSFSPQLMTLDLINQVKLGVGDRLKSFKDDLITIS